MNIRDLEYLVAVHDLNNFSKAAERCFVSQPTLSGQLKKLEAELGSSLIERSTRQVMFTSFGNDVVSHARELLQVANRIRRMAKECDDPMAGEFHIGLIPTVGPYLLPLIMPNLSADYPDAKLFVYEQKVDSLLTKLSRGELDAVIASRANWSAPVSERPLYKEGMRLAVSNTDPLAGSDRPVSLDELAGRSVIMLEDGHCLRTQVMNSCSAVGAHENKRFQATTMDTLLHMVAIGAGPTLIPGLVSDHLNPEVKYRSFSDSGPSREIVMLMRKNSSRFAELECIAEVIEDSVKPAL